MKRIEPFNSSYSDVISFFGEDVIEARIDELLTKANFFIRTDLVNGDELVVSERLVTHAVMDYFTDIKRLKTFHKIEKTNEYKILAYEIFWWLKRKPIQINTSLDEENVFVNEKFAIFLLDIFFQNEIKAINPGEQEEITSAFFDTLFYYFKYRYFTAQDLEMILLAYKAGAVTRMDNIPDLMNEGPLPDIE